MDFLPLKLSSGSDLRRSIEEISNKQSISGFVIGVVGNLSQANFQCPNRKAPTFIKDKLEIITLNGTFSSNSVHLHISISNSNCEVFGGHLEEGSIILKEVNILLGLTSGERISKYEFNQLDRETKKRVEIAILPKCPWSKRALLMLKTFSIPHKVYLVDNDQSYNSIKERSKLSTFPQIFIDDHLIGGYEELEILISDGKLKYLYE